MHMLTTQATFVTPAQAGAYPDLQLRGLVGMDPGLRRGDEQEFSS